MNGLKMNDLFAVLNNMPIGALLLNEQLRLLRMNTYAKQLFENDQMTWWHPVWQQIFPGWLGPQKDIGRQDTTYFTNKDVSLDLKAILPDGSVYGPHLKHVPILIFGPGEPTLAHQPNEYVEIEKFIAAIQYFMVFAMIYLGVEE
jgi:PAS domain-containing protein